MSGPKIDCQPFPSELGPTVEVHKEVTARKSSSQDGAIDLDSTSSIDSSTEHPTVISGNATSRLQLRGDSRHSNRSMPPATPSPPVSGNNSPNNQVTRQRRSPPQSAISRTSVRSQTPREELDPNADLDCSRCVILHPSLSPYKVISSQPPETPPTAAIIKVRSSVILL